MKTKTEKELQIIKEGRELFFKFGVKKVTVEEICSKCGISKKTFYKFYKNKFELIEVILRELIEDDYKVFERVKNEEISFKAKVIKMTEEKMKKYTSAESIFFMDVIENCKELKDFVTKVTKEGERDFLRFVIKEQASGNLRKDLPTHFISYLLTTKSSELIFDTEIGKMFPNFNERVNKIVDCLINGIEGGNSS